MMEPYAIAAGAFGAAMLVFTTYELLRRKMSLLGYFFWAVLWSALILIGVVPQFYSALLLATQALGMYTPLHFVTTFSILILFAVVYYLGKRIAELDDRLSTIVHHIALQNANIAAVNPGKGKEKLLEPRSSS